MTPPPPPPPPPGFQIIKSICATPNFKSWIRPWKGHHLGSLTLPTGCIQHRKAAIEQINKYAMPYQSSWQTAGNLHYCQSSQNAWNPLWMLSTSQVCAFSIIRFLRYQLIWPMQWLNSLKHRMQSFLCRRSRRWGSSPRHCDFLRQPSSTQDQRATRVLQRRGRQSLTRCLPHYSPFCEARRASHCHSPQTTFSSNSTCCVLSTQKSAMHVVIDVDRLTTQHSIVDIVDWSWSYW